MTWKKDRVSRRNKNKHQSRLDFLKFEELDYDIVERSDDEYVPCCSIEQWMDSDTKLSFDAWCRSLVGLPEKPRYHWQFTFYQR